MIGTVIKHEWIRTRGTLAMHAGIVTVVILVASGLAATRWPVISGLGLPLGIAALSSLVIGVLVYLAIDYWRSSYGQLGYFTQTLPLKGSTIYWGKLIYGLVVYLTAVVLAVVLGLLLWAGVADLRAGLADLWSLVGPAMTAWAWVALLFLLLLVLVTYVAQAYFAASLGSESRMRSMGSTAPVLVWLIAYAASQVVLTVAMLAIPVAATIGADGRLAFMAVNVFQVLAQGEKATAMPIGFMVGLVPFVGYMIWRTVVSWDRKVTLA